MALTQMPLDVTSRNIASSVVRFLLLGNRIDPDEHAIDVQKLFSHLVSHVIRIDRGFRGNS